MRDAFDKSADGIAVVDLNGQVLFASPSAQVLLNREHGEAIGFPLSRVEIGSRWSTLTLERADGTTASVEMRAARTSWDGQPAYVVGLRDLQQREAEFDAAERWAAAVESSTDAILCKTLDGTILSWNAGAERMYGYTAPEVLGRKVSIIVPDHAENELDDILARISRGERVENRLSTRTTRDGRGLRISLSVTPIRDRQGTITGACAIGRDMTAQWAAQERIKCINRQLAAIRNVNQLIVSERDKGALTSGVCELLVESGAYRSVCAVLQNRRGEVELVGGAHEDGAFRRRGGGMATGDLPECATRVQQRADVSTLLGVPEQCGSCPLRPGLSDGTGICMAIEHRGDTFGYLTLSLADGEVFDEEEESLVRELAGDLALALHLIDVEAERREHVALLNATGELARVGGWELDLPNDRVRWTQAVRTIHEVSDNYEPTLEDALSFFPDARETVAEAIRGAREEGEPYDLVLPFVTAKGRRLWARVIGKPEMKDGACARLYGYFQDVTEQKHAREEADRSEARFRAICESSDDAILILDQRGRHTYANPAASLLLGYPARELATMGIPDLSRPEDREDHLALFERLIAEGALSHEVELVRNDSATVFVELHAVVLPDGRLFVSCRDISERQAMESQLRQSQKLEAIGTLAGGVAHEINNPINGIMNYAQLIKDELGDGNTELSKFAEEILAETHRVASLVRNLLAFSRQDRHPHALAHVRAIVEESLALMRTIMRHDQIGLRVDVAPDLPEIVCHSQQIQQVLMNLLVNARDALNEKYPGHAESKWVSISARVMDVPLLPGDVDGATAFSVEEGGASPDTSRAVRITVEDRGPGVPEDVRDRLFDPFFTTKPRHKGTGLGLSISHGILRDHGGRITVESQPGAWTRFHIDLPLLDGGAA